ncbi:MAG: hypothetical protein HRT90_05000 [Candidatus Margulisbacteria bacterium]|nr:hypothetical protein [Candidatus Margulisiibacteriota bacterium]
METTSNRIGMFFRLASLGLFMRWSVLLISMDAYLFSDISSIVFWSSGIKKVLLAALLSSGLVVLSSAFGKKHKPISTVLTLISLVGSFFIVPEKLYWACLGVLALIHGYALFTLYKKKSP